MAQAQRALADLDLRVASGMLMAIAQLVVFDIALRRGDTGLARATISRAQRAAGVAGIPALSAEVEQAARVLAVPAARLIVRDQGRLVDRSILLEEVQAVLASKHFVVDACRRSVRREQQVVSLARRPVLFALVRTLAEFWPDEAARDVLIANAFGARRANPSHRARLRVELGRLRQELSDLADVRATAGGFTLTPRPGGQQPGTTQVLVLAPPIEGADAAVLALLADGEAWSTSALALAVGSSQRTVQRALSALQAAGKVRSLGQGRSQRWLSPPVSGFTTTLLLPSPPGVG